MEHLCPQIEQLVSCFTCGSQALPPYRLCVQAHVGCPPCTKYMSLCACGCHFLKRSNITFDWMVSAMKLRCKYRANDVDDVPEQVDCANRWYTVQELGDHYLTGCARNSFTCPLQDCGHVARIDTITDHYETAHSPFESFSFNEYEQPPKYVVLQLSAKKRSQILKKIFNGYFMFNVNLYRRKSQDFNSQLFMQNINPSDPLQYTYTTSLESNEKSFTVSITLVEPVEVYNIPSNV